MEEILKAARFASEKSLCLVHKKKCVLKLCNHNYLNTQLIYSHHDQMIMIHSKFEILNRNSDEISLNRYGSFIIGKCQCQKLNTELDL